MHLFLPLSSVSLEFSYWSDPREKEVLVTSLPLGAENPSNPSLWGKLSIAPPHKQDKKSSLVSDPKVAQ